MARDTGKRKSKRDKRAKRRYRIYKKGGKYRTINLEETKKKQKNTSK